MEGLGHGHFLTWSRPEEAQVSAVYSQFPVAWKDHDFWLSWLPVMEEHSDLRLKSKENLENKAWLIQYVKCMHMCTHRSYEGNIHAFLFLAITGMNLAENTVGGRPSLAESLSKMKLHRSSPALVLMMSQQWTKPRTSEVRERSRAGYSSSISWTLPWHRDWSELLWEIVGDLHGTCEVRWVELISESEKGSGRS